MSLERQTQALANWLAPGRVFAAGHIETTRTRALLRGLAAELLRSAEAVETFRRELLPSQALLLLPEWESTVGIPDDCFRDVAGTTEIRRRNVLIKLASLGVQTEADFEALAALLGLTVDVVSGSDSGTFPYSFPMTFFATEKEARHTILVLHSEPASESFPYTFPIPFGSEEIGILACLFSKVKPAHVQVVFVEI